MEFLNTGAEQTVGVFLIAYITLTVIYFIDKRF